MQYSFSALITSFIKVWFIMQFYVSADNFANFALCTMFVQFCNSLLYLLTFIIPQSIKWGTLLTASAWCKLLLFNVNCFQQLFIMIFTGILLSSSLTATTSSSFHMHWNMHTIFITKICIPNYTLLDLRIKFAICNI